MSNILLNPEFKLDSQQKLVAQKLSNLSLKLNEDVSQSFWQKIFDFKKSKNHSIKSLYIFGDVGRGKSMLMKGFYDSLNGIPKTYFHFNEFMQQIHKMLRDIRKEDKKYKDELIEAIKRVIKENRILCFDEFQVVDIADAMLLSRIFSYLFSNDILVIFTSNSEPKQLYKNGLQREVFLEFVDKVLLKNCEVLYLNSPTDYRSQYRHNLTERYFISNKKNRELVKNIIENLREGKAFKSKKIKLWGREIKIKKTLSNIAVLKFDELCRENYAAADYQAICQNFDLIFLLQVPCLMPEDANEAKRLMLFIDEVYENKVALIVLAKTKSQEIYKSGIGSEAFTRTVSRLNEIRSDNYWQASKINLLS
jgi:cell division protein ZapE